MNFLTIKLPNETKLFEEKSHVVATLQDLTTLSWIVNEITARSGTVLMPISMNQKIKTSILAIRTFL